MNVYGGMSEVGGSAGEGGEGEDAEGRGGWKHTESYIRNSIMQPSKHRMKEREEGEGKGNIMEVHCRMCRSSSEIPSYY
jgi:hypothetical protein